MSITYFDEGQGEVQYNSTESEDPPTYLGLITPYELTRTGTNAWKTVTIRIDNAQFKNKLQGGFADFRLNDKGGQLFVSKITIQKPQPQAKMRSVIYKCDTLDYDEEKGGAS